MLYFSVAQNSILAVFQAAGGDRATATTEIWAHMLLYVIIYVRLKIHQDTSHQIQGSCVTVLGQQ